MKFKLVLLASLLGVQFMLVAVSVAETNLENDIGVQKVSILAGSYFIKPELITLRVNVPVQLTVSQEPGMIPHNINIDAESAGMKFSQDLSSDATVIRFTPSKTGQFELFCDKQLLFFASHREKGMFSIINVIE